MKHHLYVWKLEGTEVLTFWDQTIQGRLQLESLRLRFQEMLEVHLRKIRNQYRVTDPRTGEEGKCRGLVKFGRGFRNITIDRQHTECALFCS